MLQTTLCYIEKDGKYLMLHRVSKKNDVNRDKWIGVGGHFLEGEAPEECLLREVREETGYTLDRWQFRGILTFISDAQAPEIIFLYTADRFHGEPVLCDEGTLEWVEKDRIGELNLWEGDKVMFRLMEERTGTFSLKLRYQGDTLLEARELSPEE
ncbi:MAG: 8-oxo-dGTP diphosphatase [Firmicutes bacterium]|jgi:8-oxo-dGTP diphosphatase|nr:8-oxo-dGTP diphosphatase [Bacillota bacterium]